MGSCEHRRLCCIGIYVLLCSLWYRPTELPTSKPTDYRIRHKCQYNRDVFVYRTLVTSKPPSPLHSTIYIQLHGRSKKGAGRHATWVSVIYSLYGPNSVCSLEIIALFLGGLLSKPLSYIIGGMKLFTHL